jgi:uncharacterized membrane protein YfcA
MEFLVVGLAAGVLAGLFGVGGGVIIVPALMLLAHLPAQKATGTSLGALLLPVGALGAWQYYRAGNLDAGIALRVAIGLFVGAWLGALAAHKLPSRELQRAFAVFLVFVAGQLWWSAK